MLVLGGPNTGKNTVCRILTNYSVKLGWETIFADLDPENPELSPVGTIAAASFSEYMKYDSNEINKLAYFLGKDTLTQASLESYKIIVRQLLENVDRRLLAERDYYVKDNTLPKLGQWKDEIQMRNLKNIFASGCIINTPSFISEQDPADIKAFIQLVNPKVILYIENDRLKTVLKDMQGCVVIRLPKSGGVDSLMGDEQRRMRDRLREMKVESYFFDDKLICTREQIKLSEISIWKLGKSEEGKQWIWKAGAGEVSKGLAGALGISDKVLLSAPEDKRAEAVLRAPLLALLYLCEITEEADPLLTFLRPAYSPNLSDIIWLIADIKYHHSN